MLQLGSGAAFLGSSPEQLYARTGSHVASEAVAATRARGTPGASSAACTLLPGRVCKLPASSCTLWCMVSADCGQSGCHVCRRCGG